MLVNNNVAGNIAERRRLFDRTMSDHGRTFAFFLFFILFYFFKYLFIFLN